MRSKNGGRVGRPRKLKPLTDEQLAALSEYRANNPSDKTGYNNLYRKLHKKTNYNPNKTWIKEYRIKNKTRARELQLINQYGINLDDYNSMLLAQGCVCAICGAEYPGGAGGRDKISFRVDHNHKTGVVRGLLCASCNLAIGGLKDSSDICRKAANYLDYWEGKECQRSQRLA